MEFNIENYALDTKHFCSIHNIWFLIKNVPTRDIYFIEKNKISLRTISPTLFE